MSKPPHIIVVAGPTSSGKSDFAVLYALKHTESTGQHCEIISADSRQIYRGLDIGTGKITEEEMQGVPHHMLDIIDINESFSVKEYQGRVITLIDEITSRGNLPIICGGTGYYIDAVIFKNSIPDQPIDRHLEEDLKEYSNEELFEMIKKKDPVRGNTIEPHNRIRLIRALEIIETHGKVKELEKPVLRFDVEFYLLNPKKEVLEERVHKRLLKRFDAGMLLEMQALIAEGYDIATLAKRGIEYKWMAKYLEQQISYDELIEKLCIATWQYAKRQRTWNKKYYPFAKIIE